MTSKTLTITFIRHGESTDNLRDVWAGWKDAPLSNHGMNQAQALGESLSQTRFKSIHASPLKRAYTTAQAVYDAQAEPKPLFASSLLLREQHWGVAEGYPWVWNRKNGLSLEEHFQQGIYPLLHKRSEKFPEGESLDDLARRAEQAVQELILPYVWENVHKGFKGTHIAIVSHGLCISELIPALLRKDASGIEPEDKYRGLHNTAWTRVTVDVGKEGEPLSFSNDNLPPLEVKVIDVNCYTHLTGIKRQKGGIGSAAHDAQQKDIRAFFGGQKPEDTQNKSNAEDEVNVEFK